MTNNTHDLIHQLSEKLDSLWRYKEYIKNAEECAECKKLWEECLKRDTEMVEMIKEEIKRHVDSGKFDICKECYQ